MTLQPGTSLGPYEILSALGAGGMGEVYRARDAKLNRDVALKILPAAFAMDSDRLARFKREAQVLASLNHPNIAAIYGFEESASTQALVLELVEGPTLADRIAQGPIPFDEALPIARQIAEGLEAAHEQGIIHRDLKPANIKLKNDGTVKVLDFGLAKALEPASAARSDVTASPTITTPALTGMGVILGTAAYMSPEQAKGRAADKRSDVWAFGCVLFEMLTGQRAFEGEDVSDTLATVLKGEPDWNVVPRGVPDEVRLLLKRCLEKNSRARIGDLSTARFLMTEVITPAAKPPITGMSRPRRLTQWMAWPLAIVSIVAAVVIGSVYWFEAKPQQRTVRFEVSPPQGTAFLPGTLLRMALSPDGTMLAFVVSPGGGKRNQLWVRRLDALEATALPGTDGAAAPFWSPDGRFVGFFADNKLKKSEITGGQPQSLCEVNAISGGAISGTWNQDGVILFSAPNGIRRVSASGGEPTQVTTVDQSHGVRSHVKPRFLPDGRRFLFLRNAAAPENSEISVGSLDSTSVTPIVRSEYQAEFALPGYLLFVREAVLFAQRFDQDALALQGDPVRIADNVSVFAQNSTAAFSVAESGVLIFRQGGTLQGSDLEFRWFDRTGKEISRTGGAWAYRGLDLSPDGKRVAAHRHDGRGGDIWVTDVETGDNSRLTFEPAQHNASPVWSPDGAHIAFGSLRNGSWGIYRKASSGVGAEERLFESKSLILPMDWSRDGQTIVFSLNDPKTALDLWRLPLTGDRKPLPFLQDPFGEVHGNLSPDGRWLAYGSAESGRGEIYVQSFPSPGTKYQVSTESGGFPRWRHDGKEILFMAQGSGRIMSAMVQSAGEGLRFTAPTLLFDSGYVNFVHSDTGGGIYHTFAVTPDGQRFVVPVQRSTNIDGTSPLVVVLNWTSALQR